MNNFLDIIKFEAAEANSGGTEANSEKPKKKDDNEQEKTFTQTEVNKMLAREKQQGRNSAWNNLGIDPEDEAKLTQVKKLVNAIFSDSPEQEQLPTEQLPPAIQQRITEAEKTAKENERKATQAEAKYLAVKNGVDPNYVEDVIALATTKVSDDKPLETVVLSMKETHAFYFAKQAAQQSAGTGTNVGNSQQASNDKNLNYGAKLAAQRKQQLPK